MKSFHWKFVDLFYWEEVAGRNIFADLISFFLINLKLEVESNPHPTNRHTNYGLRQLLDFIVISTKIRCWCNSFFEPIFQAKFHSAFNLIFYSIVMLTSKIVLHNIRRTWKWLGKSPWMQIKCLVGPQYVLELSLGHFIGLISVHHQKYCQSGEQAQNHSCKQVPFWSQ